MNSYNYTVAYNFDQLQQDPVARFMSVVAFYGNGENAVISAPRYMRSSNKCGWAPHSSPHFTQPRLPARARKIPLCSPLRPAIATLTPARTLTTGSGRASELFLIARLSAGNLKFLQWFSLGCGDCGVATDLCMQVGGGDTTCGQSETVCSANTDRFELIEPIDVTNLTSLANRTSPPVRLVAKNSSAVRSHADRGRAMRCTGGAQAAGASECVRVYVRRQRLARLIWLCAASRSHSLRRAISRSTLGSAAPTRETPRPGPRPARMCWSVAILNCFESPWLPLHLPGTGDRSRLGSRWRTSARTRSLHSRRPRLALQGRKPRSSRCGSPR